MPRREALARAERPLLLVGSQALVVLARRRGEIAAAVQALGIPVYLSGMARGLLGADPPLQLRHHRREALREADCVVLAGVPSDFRLDYGRHIRRGATLIAANRSRAEARRNRRPDLLAEGDAGRFLRALADRRMPDSPARRGSRPLHARDAQREARDRGSRPPHRARTSTRSRSAARSTAPPAPDATFVADGGDFVATASYTVRPRAPLAWLDPGVVRHARRGRGLRARRQALPPRFRGLDRARVTAPAATGWSSSTRSCATASA